MSVLLSYSGYVFAHGGAAHDEKMEAMDMKQGDQLNARQY